MGGKVAGGCLWAVLIAVSATALAADDASLAGWFSPSELDSWRAHARTRRALDLAGIASSLLYHLTFVLAGVSNRLRGALHRRWPKRGWAADLLFLWLWIAGAVLVQLPFALARESLAQSAGLSSYAGADWWLDHLKGAGMTAFSWTCLGLGLLGLIRRAPRRWWLLLGIPTALGLFAYGVVAPYRARLYHDFRPLDRPALKQRLETLAADAGVTLAEVRVVDASRTTRTLGAYVTGVGPSREIVLFDNLLDAASDAEIAVAVAHELSHEREHNPLPRYGAMSVALLAWLGLLAWLLPRSARCLRYDDPSDVRQLPVMALLAFFLFTGLLPIQRWQQRAEELEADRFSLELTADPEAFAQLHVRLARRNKRGLRPPWWAAALASHPPLETRLVLAADYAREQGLTAPRPPL